MPSFYDYSSAHRYCESRAIEWGSLIGLGCFTSTIASENLDSDTEAVLVEGLAEVSSVVWVGVGLGEAKLKVF